MWQASKNLRFSVGITAILLPIGKKIRCSNHRYPVKTQPDAHESVAVRPLLRPVAPFSPGSGASWLRPPAKIPIPSTKNELFPFQGPRSSRCFPRIMKSVDGESRA